MCGIGHASGDGGFSEATGTKYTMVPFKGSGPSVLAALGGHVQLSISGSAALKPHYISKEMRPLVFLGDKRSAYIRIFHGQRTGV